MSTDSLIQGGRCDEPYRRISRAIARSRPRARGSIRGHICRHLLRSRSRTSCSRRTFHPQRDWHCLMLWRLHVDQALRSMQSMSSHQTSILSFRRPNGRRWLKRKRYFAKRKETNSKKNYKGFRTNFSSRRAMFGKTSQTLSKTRTSIYLSLARMDGQEWERYCWVPWQRRSSDKPHAPF